MTSSTDVSDNGCGSYPYEIVIVKHGPSKSQYTPADKIIARHSWKPGDGLDYFTVYEDLNRFTADAVREWDNPANLDKRPCQTSSSSLPASQSKPLTPSTVVNSQAFTSPM